MFAGLMSSSSSSSIPLRSSHDSVEQCNSEFFHADVSKTHQQRYPYCTQLLAMHSTQFSVWSVAIRVEKNRSERGVGASTNASARGGPLNIPERRDDGAAWPGSLISPAVIDFAREGGTGGFRPARDVWNSAFG